MHFITNLILSVNVFSTKVLIKDRILMSPTGDGSALLFTRSSEPREGLVICRAKDLPSFVSYFKTPSIRVPGIKSTTSHFAFMGSTHCANPTEVAMRLPLNETYDKLIMSWLTLQYFTASCDFPNKT